MRALLFTFLFIPFSVKSQTLFSFSKDTILMGSAFTLTAVNEDSAVAKEAVFAGIIEIFRIEALISSWKPSSQTSIINANAGQSPVVVDEELFNLIDRSIKFSKLSNGYFDISFASLDKIWQFNGQEQALPDREELLQSVSKIDYEKILLNYENHSVLLKDAGMKIGFGAIGKGYAADRAKKIMLSFGIENGVVNASGDILAWGTKPSGELWRIGIADPSNKNKVLSTIEITDQAVVTSGSYEKFVVIDGVPHGHIINPKTGMPAKGVLSVTIIAETGEMADAMATTVFVLGEVEGLKLVNHLKGVECIIINDKNILLYSTGISLNQLYESEN